MSSGHSFLELLWVAALGARGWFLSVALVGFAMFGLTLGVNGMAEPKAVVFAFFMPLLLSAIMGTVSLGSHRARSEAWAAGSLRKPILLAAFMWNVVFGFVALIVDRVVIHFRLLSREPFAFPESIAVVAAMAAVLALLALYPRRGPQ
jgi:hypothetical protein